MESQNIEYKQSWHDDYLKTIAAFANTAGGKLFIGIGDNGVICGVENSDKLMETLPNKILNILDIHVGVFVNKQNDLQFVEIQVEKSHFPISYHGRFYTRNGSTTQELRGNTLQQFLLSAQNMTWDEVLCHEMNWEDIDSDSVTIFVRRAIIANRLPANIDQNNIRELFEKLELSRKGQLTRAATLLFSRKPTHYVFMAICKVGRFRADSNVDLITDDVIECPLFMMPDKIMELLIAKYLQKNFTYKGLQRIETLEYPELALREAILNAVVHRNYNGNSFLTIKIFDKSLEIWNEGELLDPLTIESLKTNHLSRLRNRKIADVFYRSGAIESWGRGTLNIINIAKEGGYPEPVFEEFMGGITVRFPRMILENGVKENGVKENVVKENVVKENVVKENVVKENVVKENVVKENVVKENVVKENVVKENVVKENGVKENVVKENGVKENVVKENGVKENGVKENGVKDDGVKEDVVKEDVVKDNVLKDDGVKENVVKEDVVKDNVVKEDVVKEILTLIKNKPEITTKEMAQNLNIHFRTVQRYIEILKKENKITRKGGRRQGKWIICSKFTQ